MNKHHIEPVVWLVWIERRLEALFWPLTWITTRLLMTFPRSLSHLSLTLRTRRLLKTHLVSWIILSPLKTQLNQSKPVLLRRTRRLTSPSTTWQLNHPEQTRYHLPSFPQVVFSWRRWKPLNRATQVLRQAHASCWPWGDPYLRLRSDSQEPRTFRRKSSSPLLLSRWHLKRTKWAWVIELRLYLLARRILEKVSNRVTKCTPSLRANRRE